MKGECSAMHRDGHSFRIEFDEVKKQYVAKTVYVGTKRLPGTTEKKQVTTRGVIHAQKRFRRWLTKFIINHQYAKEVNTFDYAIKMLPATSRWGS